MLADGMCPGYAAEDGAALHFVGERLARAVSSRPGARAYRMRWTGGADRAAGRCRPTTWAPRPPRSARPTRARATAPDRRDGRRRLPRPPGDPALDRYVLDVASAPHPRICLLPTAGGDAEEQIRRFYAAFRDLPCEPTHLSLFRLGAGRSTCASVLLAQDVIYVGGGSMLNLLAIWRAHGLDLMLREAWERGVVLCGISAGSMCWFEAGVTTGSGTPRPVGGLGLLPASNSVHYHASRSAARASTRPSAPSGAAGLGGGRRRRAAVRGRDLVGGGERAARRRRLLGRGDPGQRPWRRRSTAPAPEHEELSRRLRSRSRSGARRGVRRR